MPMQITGEKAGREEWHVEPERSKKSETSVKGPTKGGVKKSSKEENRNRT
jgi:hypothetical protein